MEQTLFLYPVFALILLHYIVMFVMGRRRFQAMARGEVKPGVFKLYRDADMAQTPEHLQLASRNYSNLFEMPVLFYALVPLLLHFQKLDAVTLGCLWAYVITRYIHSYVHVTHNKILIRMRVFFLGTLVLLFLWARFFVQVTF